MSGSLPGFPMIATADRKIRTFRVVGQDGGLAWTQDEEIDLNPSLSEDARVADAMLDREEIPSIA